MKPPVVLALSAVAVATVVGCGSSSKPSAAAPASAAASGGGAAASSAPTSGPGSSAGGSATQPVLTSAQTCARVTPALLHQALGGPWPAGKPSTGYVGCEYVTGAGGSVYLEVDQEALKLPPAQAGQFAAQFMHADEQGKGWVQVPGLGDEAAWNPQTGTIIERIGGSTYKAQVLKDGTSNTHAIGDSKRVLALLTAP